VLEPVLGVDVLARSREAAPSAVFLQAGEQDVRPSPEDTQEAFAATSDPKKLQVYPTDRARPERAGQSRCARLAA
jgi:hypothetical protein